MVKIKSKPKSNNQKKSPIPASMKMQVQVDDFDQKMKQSAVFESGGKLLQAAELLIELSSNSEPNRTAQLLCRAANLLKHLDSTRAVRLAESAANIESDNAITLMFFSQLLYDLKKIDPAREAALRAYKAKKTTPATLVDLGRHLITLGRCEKEAIDCVRRGYKLSGEALSLASYTLRVALQSADWELSNKITGTLLEEHKQGNIKAAAETPRTHLLWCDDQNINNQVISTFAERSYAIHDPLEKSLLPFENRKLRVGYVSSDFRDHATSLLALGLLRFHDKDKIEIFAYCTSYDDGSALRRDILSRFNHVRLITKMDDRTAAQQIIKDKIDVLVDLNGLTEGSRLGVFSYRPAAVQISYLGFPGTAGGRFVDYIIADDYTLPSDQGPLFREKIIRIPPTYQINDYYARFLPPPPKFESTGLPKDQLIIGMFNNINKVGSEIWQVWMRILVNTTKSVIWILDPGEIARDNLIKEASRYGVGKERIYFAAKTGQEPHLARMQLCNLMVDPWPYGGHTTTGDALFSGVPVIALEGKNFASRVSGGLIRAAGLGHLVAKDPDDYVRIACELLNNPSELLKMKKYLLINRSKLPVFNARGRVAQIEEAYHLAYKTYLAGQKFKDIRVALKIS